MPGQRQKGGVPFVCASRLDNCTSVLMPNNARVNPRVQDRVHNVKG